MFRVLQGCDHTNHPCCFSFWLKVEINVSIVLKPYAEHLMLGLTRRAWGEGGGGGGRMVRSTILLTTVDN